MSLKFLGHPVHPMITGFPITLWVAALAWDLVALARPGEVWPQLAYWSLASGLVVALPVAATGLWDLIRLGRDHPAERLAWWHLGAIGAAWCVLLASFVLKHRSGAAQPPSAPAVALAAFGVGLTLGGAWLGGELVFRHGVAVEARKSRDSP